MPTENIASGVDSVRAGLTAGFSSFMGFLPALLGALIVLAIGWFVSALVAKAIAKLLQLGRVEHAVQRIGIHAWLPSARPGQPVVSDTIATLVKWFVRLIFIQAAANILRMPQVTAIINNILLFIPNLIVAVLILVVGAFAARWLGTVVEGSVAGMGVSRPAVFAGITRYAIVGFAVIAAVNQVGIATALVNTLFIGLVASLALAFGLAFGLGGQGVASEITRRLYDQRRSAGLRVLPGAPPNSSLSGPANRTSSPDSRR